MKQIFAAGRLECSVSEYLDYVPWATEDHTNGHIQSCSAEAKVLLIHRFMSNRKTCYALVLDEKSSCADASSYPEAVISQYS